MKLPHLLICIYLMSLVLVPIFTPDLYPFSRAPMFCARHGQYATYTITTPRGDPLDAKWFGLEQIYNGNPIYVGVGRRPADCHNLLGEELSAPHIKKIVRAKLPVHSDVDTVLVTVRVFGTGANGRSFEEIKKYTIEVTAND